MPRGIYPRKQTQRRTSRKAAQKKREYAKFYNVLMREERTAARALLNIARLRIGQDDYSPHSLLGALAQGLGFTRQ